MGLKMRSDLDIEVKDFSTEEFSLFTQKTNKFIVLYLTH